MFGVEEYQARIIEEDDTSWENPPFSPENILTSMPHLEESRNLVAVRADIFETAPNTRKSLKLDRTNRKFNNVIQWL